MKHHSMEEASTEFLSREVCKNERISYSYEDRDINAFLRINDILKLEENDLLFAMRLYNIGIGYRDSWLERKVKRNLTSNGNADRDELGHCLSLLRTKIWRN